MGVSSFRNQTPPTKIKRHLGVPFSCPFKPPEKGSKKPKENTSTTDWCLLGLGVEIFRVGVLVVDPVLLASGDPRRSELSESRG